MTSEPAFAAMTGKTVIITGATGGIGLAAAKALSAKGARVKLVGRDPGRLEAALAAIRPNAAVEPGGYIADLASLASVRRLGAEILETTPRIDVLLLNAGALFATRRNTVDGIESTFAVNHLAPFLLTRLLWDRLIRSAPARLIVTASAAHRRTGSFDVSAQADPKSYAAFPVYGASKLANILFVREAARRLAGTGVDAYAFHPGVVATGFGAGQGLIGAAIRLAKPFLKTPEQGARTAVYLAAAPSIPGPSGGYFSDERPARPTALAQDDGLASRLWAESLRLCGLPPGD